MRSPRDDRGAIAPIVAILLVILIPLTALVVDIGQARVARADMQSLADITALDLARLMDGQKTVTQLQEEEDAVAATAKGRNKTFGDAPGLEIGWGHLSSEGEFVTLSAGVPTAVRVRASTSVTFGLMPGTGNPTRTAVATNDDPSLCFSVGTRTLALDTDQSVLSPLLDGLLRVNLGAVGYDGLVNLKDVSVPLADLAVALNAGSVEELLTTNVSLLDLAVATATVLDNQGKTLEADLLRALELTVPGLDFDILKILALDTAGDAAGLLGDVNVLDLITAGIVAANGQNAVDLNIPGLLGIKIIEPPQTTCGRSGATAKSAQVQLLLDAAVPNNPLVNSSLGLTVNIGAGSASLREIGCDEAKFRGSSAGATIGVPPGRTSNLALRVPLAQFLGFIPGLGLVLELALRALGLNHIGLDVFLSGQVAGSEGDVTARYPIDEIPPVVEIPPGGLQNTLTIQDPRVEIATGQNGLVAALGGVLNATLGAITTGLVTPLVNGTLNPLLTSILNPVLSALGIKLGVTELNAQRPETCGGIRLAW